MKLNRFFYDGLLNLGSEIILDGDEFRHAFLVLRTRETEKLCLFNGDGVDYVASVLKIGKKVVYIWCEICYLIFNENNETR